MCSAIRRRGRACRRSRRGAASASSPRRHRGCAGTAAADGIGRDSGEAGGGARGRCGGAVREG
eukprot:1355086-Pyramimonas_sp.AAC.1